MRSTSIRKSTLSLLIALPLFAGTAGCEPPPAASPDDATPAATEDTPAVADADAAAADAATTPAEGAAPEVAQTDLPSAESLFASNVDAIGGKAKIDMIKTYYREDDMEVVGQGIKINNKMWWSNGDYYSEATMPGMGLTRGWKVGEDIWSEDPINGLRKIEGKEANQQLRAMELAITATWKNHFSKAETKARRMIDGKPAIDVVLVTNDGDETVMTFDEESKLLVEQSFTQDTPMGKIPTTALSQGYKDFDGFTVSTKSSMQMAGTEIVGTMVDFKPNAKIEKGKITLPDAAKGKK